MMRLVFAKGGLLELNMWKRWPFVSECDLKMASDVTQCIVKASADAPHWQII